MFQRAWFTFVEPHMNEKFINFWYLLKKKLVFHYFKNPAEKFQESTKLMICRVCLSKKDFIAQTDTM
jgi:hypothetical protein